MDTVQSQLVSSLAKIFPAEDMTKHPKYKTASALKGETFAFQFAYRYPDAWGGEIQAEIESPLKKFITVKHVVSAPVRFTSYTHPDDDILSAEPGLYPDILRDASKPFRLAQNQWSALWISVELPKNCKPGKYPVKVAVSLVPDPQSRTEQTFTLEVLDAVLPPQKLIVTHWFHADCLAVRYGVSVWSEAHWRLLENYFKSFASHGSNMLLTPVFTPPLDTAVGGERPTVQLVKVSAKGGKYTFDFTLLDRWICLAEKCGVRYFEISHLFTQWGAKFCPKIMASVNGKEKRIFGWDTASDSKKYVAFLGAFLPELVAFLQARGLRDRVYFHCSDEPSVDHLEMYGKAVSVLRRHLTGFHICDALSNVDFYKNGLVSTPIPAEDHIEPFVEAGVKNLWTYYCCGQIDRVSNRFLHMPSARNRVLGALLYRYEIAGFLQWGFNFWYSCLSKKTIDPYADTNSDYAFPPGDAFMVYPGEDGMPEESIHHEVFAEGMQDLRALNLLEEKIGRKKLSALLDKATPSGKMTMTDYPRGEEALLALRKKINELIRKHM